MKKVTNAERVPLPSEREFPPPASSVAEALRDCQDRLERELKELEQRFPKMSEPGPAITV